MKEKKITAYKGFDKDMKCRGFQYEVGKEYEMEGGIKVCEHGFHACENPMDVLDYYGDMLNDRYCVVEQSGNFHKNTDGSKTASSKINVKAEIGWEDFFKFGIEWLKEITNPEKVKTIDTSLNDNGGDSAKIGSSGNHAQIGSSGYYAQIGSSGYSARIGSSGDSAKIGSSGDSAQIGSSGDHARINSTGETSVIMCAGGNSTVRAKVGSWITLSEWKYSEEKFRYIPVCVKTEYVDGERIKADTWYRLENGEFKEVME